LSLCAAEPATLLTVAAAARALARPLEIEVAPGPAGSAAAVFDDLDPISDSVADAAIDTLTDRLLLDLEPVGSRVAPSTPFGRTTLATNVQHGAAGILGILVQAWRIRRDPRLLQPIDGLARWLDRACERPPGAGPVGLYFGSAGPCWALADAGLALGHDSLVQRAVTRALALPTNWPSPDVTHGIAGLGLTLIHLWQVTGDPRLRDAVAQVATRLIETAEFDGADVSWRTPREVQSSFAGQRFYGFAHGVAGIGLFLDHAAAVTGREDCAAATEASAATLRHAALAANGLVKWGSGPDEPTPGLPHWCNGSSGVATFLLRHAGGANDVELLEGAARATVAAKWQSGVAYCHGLSGNADLLLDLSDPADIRYRVWAADLLRIMWDRRSSDGHGTGLTDEPSYITPDFNVGYGGALSVLLRLRHGGPRLWLPERAA
jgi:lantibiotic modifying enzyme